MRSQRLFVPLSLCMASVVFITTGGACLPSSPPPSPPPALRDAQYILIASGSQSPPQVTFTDASGRRIRVLADTIQFETATQHYVERGTIAITPTGGTEQAPTPIALGNQTYTSTSQVQFDLPVTIAGIAHGAVLDNSTLDLRMPDGSHWTLRAR